MSGIRIIAGAYKNRPLSAGEDAHIRPSKNQVRAAMLNTLSSRLDFNDISVLDTFCGSGALGIECLSRGAAHTTFVDTDTRTVKKNLQSLNIEASRYSVIQTDVSRLALSRMYDVIFADPPYGENHLENLFAKAESIGTKGTFWLVEEKSGTTLNLPDNLKEMKAKKFGKSSFWLLEQV